MRPSNPALASTGPNLSYGVEGMRPNQVRQKLEVMIVRTAPPAPPAKPPGRTAWWPELHELQRGEEAVDDAR